MRRWRGNPRYPAAAEALLGDLSVTPQRLLQAEAILQTLGSPLNADSHPGVEVKFLRLSTSPLTELKADPPSSFTYLYGAQLGHFAGFVRRYLARPRLAGGKARRRLAIMLLLLNRSRIAESGLSNPRLHELLTEATQASLASPSAHLGRGTRPRGARITRPPDGVRAGGLAGRLPRPDPFAHPVRGASRARGAGLGRA